MKTIMKKTTQNLRMSTAWLLALFAWLMPQGMRAADSGLETAFVDDKSYYVLRSASDWEAFRRLVVAANGNSDVNAIMDADFTVSTMVGTDAYPYNGTFNGNGHTLNLNINGGDNQFIAPFSIVGNVTIKNLKTTGSVTGGDRSAGLIGHAYSDSQSNSITLESVNAEANVTTNSSKAGGIIGDTWNAKVTMQDVRAWCWVDAYGSDAYVGSVIGWGNNAENWSLHRVYEWVEQKYTRPAHVAFAFWAAKTWADDKNSTWISYHALPDVEEEYRNKTISDAVTIFNQEQPGSWTSGGLPVMAVWPTADDVTFETYDMVPGMEDADKGMLKIPFSCDKPIKYMDVSYTNEKGERKNLNRINFDKDTYAGFINVPANEQHKNMQITAKLTVGTLVATRNDADDAVLHTPQGLTATTLGYKKGSPLTDAGAVELKWSVNDASYKDVFDGDMFSILRSLTGKDEDMQIIGSVTFDSGTSEYSFKDSTLVASLTAEQLQSGSVTPHYLVVRATAQQLWGLTNNAASARVSTPLINLHLLQVRDDFKADWKDMAQRTITVDWNYGDEAGVVWDSRAQMKMLVTATNRQGEVVDSTIYVLTEQEIAACTKEVQLTRSCVNYSIEFLTESSTSTKNGFFTIRTAADWDTFCSMVSEARNQYDIHAWLMADISVSNQAGINSNAPFRGTFEGNGHTMTFNITGNSEINGPFRYVSNATIRNLHTAGSITTSRKFAAGLAADVTGNLLVEGCRVSVDINSSVNGDATNGGFVAYAFPGTTITLRNSKFDGKLRGAQCHSNGGMVGYSTGQVTIENCLFAPAEVSTKTDGCNTWSRIGGSGNLTVTNSYCTVRTYPNAVEYSSENGLQARLGSGWTKDGSGKPVPQTSISQPVGNLLVGSGFATKDEITIRSAADWDKFCSMVDEARNQYDIHAWLMADISVSDQAGINSNAPYRGTFDGNGHTMTFNITGNQQRNAPFRYVSNATIRNLHTAGSITTSQKFAAGLVADVTGNLLVEGCHSSVDINSSVNGDATNGGFVAYGSNGGTTITLRNSKFDGKLRGAQCHSNGGMVGYSTGQVTIENCLFAPTEVSTKTDGCNTWARLGGGSKLTLANCYYTTLYGDEPHENARSASNMSDAALLAALGSGWTKDSSGKPVPRTSSSQPAFVVGNPWISGLFYYESLGHIKENSLQTETRQSSVLLTWEKTEDTVDYFRVERRNLPKGPWEVIAPQVTYQEYEDKTVSPVFDYEYRVTSVNQCEGLHETTSAEVAGSCVKTGKVEGYVRFADGTGIPGIKVTVSPTSTQKDIAPATCETDESGFYSVENLRYWGNQQGAYQITVTDKDISNDDFSEDCKGGLYVTFDARSNYEKNRNFTVTTGIRFSGLVMYQGTSIPVRGARFMVDEHEVRTSGGVVESDFEGKFSFRMLRGSHEVQAVMKDHTFTDDGYYMRDGKKKVDFQTDVANTYFYDSKRVKLIGRVAGGHVQGELPLGNSLSTNNLGDSLKLVLTLEGDNASWLVFDNTNRSLTTRDTVYTHHKPDRADRDNYATHVHTERHRMVVMPDVLTGEYEVLLPPVKWKIQQITAEGYATLFQDGQTSDVIDLTDSLTLHTDKVKGQWRSRGGVDLTEVTEEYNAKYSRIYHSPVLLERAQQGFDPFDYFGEKTFTYQPLGGPKQKIPIAYSTTVKDEKSGRDVTTTHYTFGYPVFATDRGYSLKLSAVERYYYNNVQGSDTVDVVKLDGGFVTIRNGLMNGTQCDTLSLDSEGEGYYTLRADRTPYLLTGTGALCTVTFTMERDGTTFEGEPLRGYVFSAQSATGARDYVSNSQPILVDILRDPPGGGSSAKLSKGSSLRLAYQMDMAWKGGVSIGVNAGSGQDFYTGIWAGMGTGGNYGQVGHTEGVFNNNFDIVFSGTGQRAFSYTMTANEDISTSDASTMVGADADLYMGMETNLFVRPAVAIQAISDSAFTASAGALAAGRMVEIASGRDDKGSLFHLVRTEVLMPGQTVNSTFVHSQQYIAKQLIPGLVSECRSQMYTGSLADAQAEANRQQKRIYLSLVPETDESRFGVVNTDKSGNYVYHTTSNNYKAADPSLMNYVIVLPNGDNGSVQTDTIQALCSTIGAWANMIARNEKEKLEAKESNKVKNFDVDGGGTVSYAEEFSTEYSNTSSYNWLGTDFTHNYFANPDPSNPDAYGDTERAEAAFAQIGPMLGNTVAKFLAGMFAKGTLGKTSVDNIEKVKDNMMADYKITFAGVAWHFSLNPVAAYGITPKNSEATKYSRKESFTVKMDKKSHLDFDVYTCDVIDSRSQTDANGTLDVFVEENFLNNVDYVEYFLDRDVGSREIVDKMIKPRGFIYRTRGGATVRPWEPARKTLFERTGTVIDERTKKIENPIIKMDRQSISGVPHDEPARFKLYLTNESEQPDAIGGALEYYTLYAESKMNAKGARMTVDGIPLSADGTTVKLLPGEVTEKTLEVWAGEDFDYDDLQIGVISQGDVQCVDVVTFSVHFLPTAGNIEIASPGDKWIMNCDAPSDSKQGWYMPVIISGFNKQQRNFDHIEFQYKESTRGDDYWTNLCGYYADSTLYKQATGTHEMIPENGNIVAKFYGEGTVMEKAYDLRARLFCRNGNSFITSDSKVLSGIKDTRRPQLFGTPDPKDGIVGDGDNIVFHFTEAIEHNYLQKATNFEVVGETNETALAEEPSLLFTGKGYAETDARRNFADKNMTIDLMVRPDETGEDMPLFSHGTDGNKLQLWLTKDWRLRAVIDDQTLESSHELKKGTLLHVGLILDNDNQQAMLYNDGIVGTLSNVTYSGYGPLIFGATNEVPAGDRTHYSGRMLEARLWNRAMTAGLMDTYGNRQLTGYEMGLVAYYPMNDGESQYAVDKAHGANAELHGASWALPRGMSLRLDKKEQKEVNGMQLDYSKMLRSAEQDYTLMFWFKTDKEGQGALLSNGSGAVTDDDARNKFFIGFEDDELRYRTNGRTFPLGKDLADDEWHHFALTVDRSHQVANLYVDRVLTQSFSPDTLGGMMGRDFYVGNMVWHNAGADVQTLHQEKALDGHIDELCLFSQALPPTLMKRYSTKSPSGTEKGLLVYMGFNRQERQQNNDLVLRPYALNQLVKLDKDGNPTDVHDSVFTEPVAYVMQHIDQAYGAPVQANRELRNLNFSFVGRDNELLVNIDELDSRINKRNVWVTVTDIPDLNGNYMASPATAEFFVDRNPLRWEVRSLNKRVDYYESDYNNSFTVAISNNSGVSHTYTIDNMPRWLTVDRQTDIIGPKAEYSLQFRVIKDLNVGTYDHIIYLTDENGLAEPLALTVRKDGLMPDWIVNDTLKHFSMNLVGQVKIGDAIVTDEKDVVAAFDAMNRCLGLANVSYNPTTGKSQLFMTLFNNEANKSDISLTFKLWHNQTGQVMVLEPDREVNFRHSTVAGSVDNPIVLTGGSLYYQELELWPGWNWISLNLDSKAYSDVTGMLKQFEWQDRDIVTDDAEDITLIYNSSQNKWEPNNSEKMDTFTISPQRCYRIFVHNNVNVEIKGYPLRDESQRTLKVGHGWNSIGYTPMVNLPVATALADYTGSASNGDVVKSREEFAIFTETSVGGGYWSGSLQYMKPGEGYMLFRNGEDKASFHYPYYELGSNFFERTVQSLAPAMDYGRTMSVVAAAEGIDVQEGDRLLAFSQGELRGETTVIGTTDDESGRPLFFLSIAGEKKAPLSFAIERDGDLIAATAEVMTYESNAVSGTPEEPTAINFVKTDAADGGWYTLQGYKLSAKPTHKGLYIHNGKIQIVK